MSLQITLNVNATALLVGLRNSEKRIRFAIRDAINKTALDVQKGEVAGLKRTYQVRRPEFILRQAAVIKPFAKLERLEAQISVGKKKRLLLRAFELGRERPGQTALKKLGVAGVAVPIQARPSPSEVVPQEMWVSKLQLKKAKAGRALRGTRGVYLAGLSAIFQQVAGAAHARLLYIIKPSVKKAKPYGFAAIAENTANKVFAPHLSREVAETLRRNLK